MQLPGLVAGGRHKVLPLSNVKREPLARLAAALALAGILAFAGVVIRLAPALALTRVLAFTRMPFLLVCHLRYLEAKLLGTF